MFILKVTHPDCRKLTFKEKTLTDIADIIDDAIYCDGFTKKDTKKYFRVYDSKTPEKSIPFDLVTQMEKPCEKCFPDSTATLKRVRCQFN